MALSNSLFIFLWLVLNFSCCKEIYSFPKIDLESRDLWVSLRLPFIDWLEKEPRLVFTCVNPKPSFSFSRSCLLAGRWWPMTLTAALGRQRQADLSEFETSVVYEVSSRAMEGLEFQPQHPLGVQLRFSLAVENWLRKGIWRVEQTYWRSFCMFLYSLDDEEKWEREGKKKGRSPHSFQVI